MRELYGFALEGAGDCRILRDGWEGSPEYRGPDQGGAALQKQMDVADKLYSADHVAPRRKINRTSPLFAASGHGVGYGVGI
jgi:hypothetical protein